MDFYSGTKRTNDEGAFDAAKRQKTAEPSKVLHVRGLPAYVTEAELKTVVAPFGQVVKCFIMPEKHQAFVQMESIEAAQELLNNLEYSQPSIRSKAVYFQFSSRTEVENKTPGGDAGTDGASPIILLTISNVSVPITLDNIHAICKPYGEVMKIITFTKGMDFQALVQMGTVDAAINAKNFLEGKDMFQGCCHIRVGFSKRQNLMIRENSHKSRDFTQGNNAGYGGMIGGMGQQMAGGMGGMPGMPGMGQMGGMPPQHQQGQQRYGGMPGMGGMGFGSPVVLVNKLNPELINADILATLFGIYGDVLRVKILYNKRDTAMIQFNTPLQASAAAQNLNGCPLHGQNILVNSSKHTEIKLPREAGGDSADLTKDYTTSNQHRYKLASNPIKNINAPSQVLHVANLHDAATAGEIRTLFQTAQPHSEQEPLVEFFKTSKKMAYIGMCSVEVAVEAVVALHNNKFGGYPIRVSFSPKEISSIKNEQ